MLLTASDARSLPRSAASRAVSVALSLKFFMSSLTLFVVSCVLPLGAIAFATALTAAFGLTAVFGLELVFAAGFAATVGLLVAAISFLLDGLILKRIFVLQVP